ncbi:hypothetical protein KI387_023537, partial [Taxus chinensis]
MIHTLQYPNGGSSSSKEVNNSQPSKVDNIATWYEEYRALLENIRDAMSFVEFMRVSKGRSRPKPWSRATQEEELGLQVMEEYIMQVEEGEIMEFEPKKEEEEPKLLGIEREQPMGALEAPITIAKVELLTNFQNSSVKTSKFNRSLKYEPRKEREIMEHEFQ